MTRWFYTSLAKQPDVPGALKLWPFMAHGLRMIHRDVLARQPELCSKTRDDLLHSMELFRTLYPIAKWRVEPEADERVDFETDMRWFQIYARGWLDIAVSFDTPTLVIEL